MKYLDLLLVSLLASASSALAATPVSLAGQWRFQLDRADAGMSERWFDRQLAAKINLPGTLAGQGLGDDITTNTVWTGGIVDKSWFTAPEMAKYREPGNVKVPFWLQPAKYYAGAAWYQRDLTISPDWQGQRVVLTLERPHWETRVWLDGQPIGTNNALATPHEYDLGQIAPGKHTLTIRVDNRMVVDVGQDSHSVSDHTQGNWNGIVGRIELRATPLVWIEDLQVYPLAAQRTFKIKAHIRNPSGLPGVGKLTLDVIELADPKADRAAHFRPLRLRVPCFWSAPDADFSWEAPTEDVPGLELWNEFNPRVYQLTATLPNGASKTLTFGLRDLSTSGTQFTINGRKTFFRGTLDCCIFPKTGHPPTEVAEWKRIIGVAKAHGLNLIRFHSWCPPEAAFQAADELGFYFHVEASSWANSSASLGDGKAVDQWLYDETDRILKSYGNHPSFILMPYGNEPGGKNHAAWLAKWVNHYKASDPRRLWSSGAGWPEIAENQWHCLPDPRLQAWGAGLNSRINAQPPETTTDYRDYISKRTVPVISHEIGQWCVYPNFAEMKKYTGYLKPRNFEIFRDQLAATGLSRFAKQFLLASGKLQALCYKEDIESALRTPSMGGFELLDLHDFPGQGTALVGVLDPFWEEKGYITPKAFRRFCNATVPLARLSRRVFTTSDRLTATIEIAHFGAAPLAAAVVEWKLVDSAGAIYARGEFPAKMIPVDNGFAVGSVDVDLKNIRAPAACKLVVKVRGTDFENDWDIWVYPAKPAKEPMKDVLVTAQFDIAAQKHLDSGGKLLLTIPGKQVHNFATAPVKLGFSSIFWNTAWTGRQAPTTLGILCDPKNPALAGFPTEFHSNWQWWYLIHRAGALRLDLLPQGIEPIVRVIDDWVTARPLGLVVEGKVGAGRVLICGFDLTRDADDPVSRQMRASLLRYMDSSKFAPKTELKSAEIESLIIVPSLGKLGAIRSITASSAQEDLAAEKAIDGDPTTFWHTAWQASPAKFPHELVLELEAPRMIAGFTALPRQDGNRNGWISDYAFYVSPDGINWGQPAARGTFEADVLEKTVHFPAPVAGRFVKLVALGGACRWSVGLAGRTGFDSGETAPVVISHPAKPVSR